MPYHVSLAAHGHELLHAQVTLLREHCQGPNRMMFVLPTGGFEPRRHDSREVRRCSIVNPTY